MGFQEFFEKRVLKREHFLGFFGIGFVIVAKQVQKSMQNHVTEFGLLSESMLFGLFADDIRANHEFTELRFVLRIEAENVGCVVFAAKLFIELLCGFWIQKGDDEFFVSVLFGCDVLGRAFVDLRDPLREEPTRDSGFRLIDEGKVDHDLFSEIGQRGSRVVWVRWLVE